MGQAYKRWRVALPHAELVKLTEAGYYPHLDEPVQVVDAIRKFFEAHP